MAAPPQINNTFGSILIGSFVGLVMYGMTVQAAYRYFRSYPTDPWRLKGMIIVLVYYYLVLLHDSDASALDKGVWHDRTDGQRSSASQCVQGSIADGYPFWPQRTTNTWPPQWYESLEWVLWHLNWPAQFQVPLMLSELGFSIDYIRFLVGTFTEWEHKAWLDGVTLVIVLVADVIVAATMVIILYRSHTGIKR
ncbi:hypothetical protein V8D89_012743 [Ganoderma adspersum]